MEESCRRQAASSLLAKGVVLLGILQWSPSIHAFTTNLPIQSSWKPIHRSEQQQTLLNHRLYSSFDDRDSGDDGNNNDDEEESNPRMRDRIRGWFRSSSSKDDEPERVKTNFDGLFSDMPGINDILGDGIGNDEPQETVAQSKKNRSTDQDYSWFEEEKQQIIQNYEGILNDMLENLESQKREDPESVPENAEAMVKSVLKQEMDNELKETQERRAMERLDSYEQTERTRVEEEDVSGPVTDSRLQKLIDESELEYERQMKAQLELDEFLKYEEEATVKTQKPDSPTDITMPEPDANLDQWALERLEEMAQAKEDLGADEVLDILDDNLQDLKDRMEKESAKGSLQPETMKEWQMYRAIATRLGASVDTSGKVVKNVADGQSITNEDIFLRLQSWKEYNEKEIGIRERGGLSRGPKLPFEWQELSDSSSRKISGTKASRMETRKQINRMSIEALESLMATSDESRREKLQNEIDYLKRELEDKDYLDWEEPDDVEDTTGPVDLTDVFSSISTDTKKTSERVESKPPSIPLGTVSSPSVEQNSVPPPPSNTPFFSEPEPEESTLSQKPPATPFFSDDESVDMEAAKTDSKLGGMEDQNLENMFRKAGARTKEERDRIRSGYEEFKRVEEEKRKASGLEGSVDNPSEYEAKYNVSEVMLEGGDFDAQKILSSIGPRPKRGKKVTDPESTLNPALGSTIDEEDVAASLYRSVSASGGGRFKDDPSAKATFMDFLETEKSMRETVDSITEEQLGASSLEGNIDDDEYAERVMSEIGPRPATKRYSRIDEEYLSDNSGLLKGDELDDDDDDNEESLQDADDIVQMDEDVPEWVKEERDGSDNSPRKAFLSVNDIEDTFPDDEYEHNMRQLAEYERRRAGKEPRQMGIDISDILGPRRRQDFDTDDYKDYKYDDDYYRGSRVGWGQTTFETRKRDLLDYTELDVPLLNALMEQRDAVSSSGVSRYMAKINKPFKEFGAIFRLEGVVVDISGLQAKAWMKTAESLGTRTPIFDEVKMASVVRPEYAISDIFGWTTDVYEMQQIASKYQEFFAEVFNEWADNQGLEGQTPNVGDPAVSERGSLALGEELLDAPEPSTSTEALSENEILNLLMQSWGETASRFGYPRPNQDQLVAAASMEADLAISEVFGWTSDPLLVDDIVSFQRKTMETLRKGGDISSAQTAQPRERAATEPPKQPVLDQSTLMELHYKAWIDVASKYGYDQPTTDEVLSAFVLNDPALVIKGGFGWTSDADVAQEVAQGFTESLRTMLNNPPDTVYGQLVQKENLDADEILDEEESSSTSGPSFNDILSMHSEAWVSTSQIHGYTPPTLDQVKLSINMEPKDFIERIVRWSNDPALTTSIQTSFRESLKVSSQALMEKMGFVAPEAQDVNEPAQGRIRSTSLPEDLYDTAYEAWDAVASRFRLPPPTTDQILYAMSVGPENAIQFGFRWTNDEDNMTELLKAYQEVISEKRPQWTSTESDDNDSPDVDEIPLVHVSSGADKWIKSLMDVEMECGVISHLTRSQMNKLLEFAGIADLIDHEKRVPAASNSGRLFPTVKHYFDSQQMLAAALRVERRPDHCVIIDASPGASIAARSVEMQSVAWIGSFPRYELLQADSTVSRLDELTAMNIRRLFGERIFDQPLLDQQQADPEIKKKIKTKFNWDD